MACVEEGQAVGWIDDVSMVVTGHTAAENCASLERTMAKASRWARTHSADFAPQKYELIYYSPRKRVDAEDLATGAGVRGESQQECKAAGPRPG